MSLRTPLNPLYAESLDCMADTILPALGGPITDAEISVIEQPLFVTQAASLPAMRAGLMRAPDSYIAAVPLEEQELLRGIAAPTLTYKRHKLPQVISGWGELDPTIRPNVVRTDNIVAFATRRQRDMDKFGNTESLALYDKDKAIALAAVTRVLFARLDSLQDNCARNFADDPITLLYKRVAKPAQEHGLNLGRIIDTPTEGVVSIAQANSQIEADFASRGLERPNEKDLSRMVLSYTAAVTYGYFGEMSLRGMRFAGQFNYDGSMNKRYHAFFTHLQTTHETRDPSEGFVTANDGEGCPAAKRAKRAAQAILMKFMGPYVAVGHKVDDCFASNRAKKPEIKTFSQAASDMTVYDTESYDTDMCMRTPVN